MASKSDEIGLHAAQRERAEQAERAERALGGSPAAGAGWPRPEGMQSALRELRVSQIQLEMQRVELQGAQEALERLRARYFDLYENAPVGYLVLDEQGTIVEANLTVAGLLGVGRSRLIDHPLADYVVSEDRALHVQHIQGLFTSSEPRVWEPRLLRRHHAPFWSRVDASIVPGSNGRTLCRAVLSDIDEQRRVEDALREQCRVLDEVLEFTVSGTWEWDLGTGAQRLSPALERMVGYDGDRPPGSPAALRSLISSADLRGFQETIERYLHQPGSKPFSTELRCQRQDGTTFWVTCAGRVIDRGTDGTAERLAGCVIDITELKRLESELSALQLLLDRGLAE